MTEKVYKRFKVANITNDTNFAYVKRGIQEHKGLYSVKLSFWEPWYVVIGNPSDEGINVDSFVGGYDVY